MQKPILSDTKLRCEASNNRVRASIALGIPRCLEVTWGHEVMTNVCGSDHDRHAKVQLRKVDRLVAVTSVHYTVSPLSFPSTHLISSPQQLCFPSVGFLGKPVSRDLVCPTRNSPLPTRLLALLFVDLLDAVPMVGELIR